MLTQLGKNMKTAMKIFLLAFLVHTTLKKLRAFIHFYW